MGTLVQLRTTNALTASFCRRQGRVCSTLTGNLANAKSHYQTSNRREAIRRMFICETCQKRRKRPKLTRNVSFPSPCGWYTITSITPSVGGASPASYHSCHPNIMDFDEMPPTRFGRGSGAVKGHTLWTSIYMMSSMLFTLTCIKTVLKVQMYVEESCRDPLK